ncbi:MAG: L-lactate permease, partial [Desulfovibrionaceae bacterium]|nr:L-lactate permease [Desulfovibrionaceae bacterium]
MFILSVLSAFLPVLLILVLLLRFRVAIDVAGAVGLALTILLALCRFDTAPSVVALSVLAGAIGSLPVSLVLAAGIFQISVMAEMGAVARLAALMKTLAPGRQAVQVLLINVGFGILLTGLGAATVAILPPILLALGYSVSAAILLPALGYVALCMYALLGVPAVVLATFAGQPVYETGLALASFMPIISTCVAFATLYVTGGLRLVRRGLWPALLTGLSSGFTAVVLARLGLVTVTAILAGLAVMLVLVLYVKCTGRPLHDPTLGTEADREAERRLSLIRACSPWLLLTFFSLLLNTPALPFFDLVFRQWSMPLDIIPGAPERLRLFWQAYFWVIVCTLLCLPLLRATRRGMAAACRKSLHRAWRPFLATV